MFTYKKDCSMESSNCEAYLQPSILIFFKINFSSRQNVYLSWHRSTWLSIGFPFPIGQVRSQVWCWPYLAAYFGFFELRKFPWSLSKVQVGRFYPFTLKVGFKCRKTIGLMSKNNRSARAFYILVHFFAVLCKATT